MHIAETVGNRDLLDREKTLFLCSKHTPIELYGQVFRWVDSLSQKNCIVCFNTTEMEEEVMKALLVNRVPTILVVMNRYRDTNNIQVELALKEGRLLIVVLKRDDFDGNVFTPRLRNGFVASQVQHIVCGYVNKNGSVFSVLAGRQNVEYLMKDELLKTVAEPDYTHYRWTVAEDKILLRMFYDDMGIHATKKKLCRSYQAIYQRIRSITLPDDVLKGREFEDLVLSLFKVGKDNGLVLKEWRGDKTQGAVYPEGNRYPDFVFAYNKDGVSSDFAVECKWRARLKDIEKDIFSPEKKTIYYTFATEHKMPVFIVLGAGGEPCNPEYTYIIPLQEINNIVSGAKPLKTFCLKTTNDILSQIII